MSKIEQFANALEKELRASPNPAKDPNFRGMRDVWITMKSRAKQNITANYEKSTIEQDLKSGLDMHRGKTSVAAKYVKPEFVDGYIRAQEIWDEMK